MNRLLTLILIFAGALCNLEAQNRLSPACRSFITKMYNDKLYEDYDFLLKHCSPELLKKLQDAYPYDSDEPAYAVWLFRSGQQDCKPGSDCKTMLLDVTADGEWYAYTALDMGWKFTNRIKVIKKGGKFIISDIDQAL